MKPGYGHGHRHGYRDTAKLKNIGHMTRYAYAY